MYEEVVKNNGIPDTINFDKSVFLLRYIWHGCNGTIIYNLFYNGTIIIVFALAPRPLSEAVTTLIHDPFLNSIMALF